MAPSLPIGELRAMTAETYASLMKMGEDFEAAATELVEMQSAAWAGIEKSLVQTEERLAELEAEGEARVADLGKQVALAEIEAQQQTDRAFEVAQVIAEAAQKSAVAGVDNARDRVDRIFNEIGGQLAAGKASAEQEAAYIIARANQLLDYRGQEHEAARLARDAVLATAEARFAGLFYDKLEEYAWDYVQDATGIALVMNVVDKVGELATSAYDCLSELAGETWEYVALWGELYWRNLWHPSQMEDAWARYGTYAGWGIAAVSGTLAVGVWAWGAAGLSTFGAGLVQTSECSVVFQVNGIWHMGTASGITAYPTGWIQVGYWTSITGVPIINAKAAAAGAGSAALWFSNHPCLSHALQGFLNGLNPWK